MLPPVSEEEAAAPEEEGLAVLGQEDEGGQVRRRRDAELLEHAGRALEFAIEEGRDRVAGFLYTGPPDLAAPAEATGAAVGAQLRYFCSGAPDGDAVGAQLRYCIGGGPAAAQLR